MSQDSNNVASTVNVANQIGVTVLPIPGRRRRRSLVSTNTGLPVTHVSNEKLSLGLQALNSWLRQRLGADGNQDPVDALASYLHSQAISFLKLGFHQDCEELRVLYTQFSV